MTIGSMSTWETSVGVTMMALLSYAMYVVFGPIPTLVYLFVFFIIGLKSGFEITKGFKITWETSAHAFMMALISYVLYILGGKIGSGAALAFIVLFVGVAIVKGYLVACRTMYIGAFSLLGSSILYVFTGPILAFAEIFIGIALISESLHDQDQPPKDQPLKNQPLKRLG